MSDVSIGVRGLGKQYRLRRAGPRYQTLRERVMELGRAPLAALRREPPSDTFWALRDVSFEVTRGEVVGIVGHNGAGKSTLLKILSRITEPTEGEAEIGGRVGSLLEIGTGFHFELSGRENIFLNGAILGMRRQEIARKFDEIVAFAEVERFIDTPVKFYSSGMYMRLGFAVAAHLEPDILVVDEVLAVGDGAFQRKCLGKMGDVARGGRTVLFVSHNLAAVRTLCSSALHLRGGMVVAQGPTASVLAGYVREQQEDRAAGATVITQDLNLLELGAEPRLVVSGESTAWRLRVRATADVVIEELAILLYAAEARVAVIDLRSESGPVRALAGQTLSFTVEAPRVPLVEGEYALGLRVRTRAGRAELYGVGSLEVGPAARSGGVVPYPAAQRGIVELMTSSPRVEIE